MKVNVRLNVSTLCVCLAFTLSPLATHALTEGHYTYTVANVVLPGSLTNIGNCALLIETIHPDTFRSEIATYLNAAVADGGTES